MSVSSLVHPVSKTTADVAHIGRSEDVNAGIDGGTLSIKLGHEVKVHLCLVVPSAGLGGEVGLSNFEVSLCLSEVGLLDADEPVGLSKEESVLDDPGLGLGDGLSVKLDESIVCAKLELLLVVEVSECLVEGVEEVTEKGEDLLGGGTGGVLLGEGGEGLDDVGELAHARELLGELLDVVLGLPDLNKSGFGVQKTLDEAHALLNSLDGELDFLNLEQVPGVGHLSLTGGLVPGFLSVDDELLVVGNSGLVREPGGVEGVEKVGGGDTDPDLGIPDPELDFVFDGVVLGKGDLVVFLLGLDLEPEVTDEVLEGGDELINGSTSLELEIEEANGDSSPSGLLELFELVVELDLGGRLEADTEGAGNEQSEAEYGR